MAEKPVETIISTPPTYPPDIEKFINSAELAKANGEIDVAIELLQEAYKIALASDSQDDKVLYSILEQIESLATRKHDYRTALDCMFEQYFIMKKNPNITWDEQLMAYQAMPYYLAKIGDRQSVDTLMPIFEQMAQRAKTHLAKGVYFLGKGLIHAHFNEAELAQEAYSNAKSELSKSGTDQAFSLLENWSQLYAGCYNLKGDTSASKEAYRNIAELALSKYGRNSLEYSRALFDQANAEAVDGDIKIGVDHYIEASQYLRNTIINELNTKKVSERENYWKDVENILWHMASFGIAAQEQCSEYTLAAYESLVFCKGFLLASERSTLDIVNSTEDQQIIDDYNKLLALRNSLEVKIKNKSIWDLSRNYEQIDSLDKVLVQHLTRSDIKPIVTNITTQEIASALSPGEVVVDFADFQSIKQQDQLYAAYVLRYGDQYPTLINVFRQRQLEDILSDNNGIFWKLCLPQVSQKVIDLIWEPLVPVIGEAKKVYFVPSGILNQIPLESLVLEDDSTLSKKYNITRLSSSKEILDYNKDHNKDKGFSNAILYGDLKYDVAPELMAENVRHYQARYDVADIRGAKIGSNEPKGFDPLKYSKPEIEEVHNILSQAGVEVTKRVELNGTEESFFDMDGHSPELLLMSTHGFYYSPEKVPSWSSLNGYNNAMYLTGLVLTGGNAEYMGKEIPEGVMGGLLTSSDIEMLDLSNTELVLLSACETGLGETTNEGVYGLQRAFKKAGAKTLVMSLWPVHDEAAYKFMTYFHKGLVDHDFDRRKAFDIAQDQVRKEYNTPMYWAPFIMVD